MTYSIYCAVSTQRFLQSYSETEAFSLFFADSIAQHRVQFSFLKKKSAACNAIVFNYQFWDKLLRKLHSVQLHAVLIILLKLKTACSILIDSARGSASTQSLPPGSRQLITQLLKNTTECPQSTNTSRVDGQYSLPSSSTNVSNTASFSGWSTSAQESLSSLCSTYSGPTKSSENNHRLDRFDVDAWISSTLCFEGDKINSVTSLERPTTTTTEQNWSQNNFIPNDASSINNDSQGVTTIPSFSDVPSFICMNSNSSGVGTVDDKRGTVSDDEEDAQEELASARYITTASPGQW